MVEPTKDMLGKSGQIFANLPMLAAPNLSAQCAPSLISKDVLSRLDLDFGNTLRHEASENRGIVTETQSVYGATECFDLFDFGGYGRTC
jgi:hypothetical protein